MELTIVSPEKKEQFTVNWIEFNTPLGNQIIQSGHAPTILSLVAHKPFIVGLADGITMQRMIFSSAFAHITRTNTTILTGDAQPL